MRAKDGGPKPKPATLVGPVDSSISLDRVAEGVRFTAELGGVRVSGTLKIQSAKALAARLWEIADAPWGEPKGGPKP